MSLRSSMMAWLLLPYGVCLSPAGIVSDEIKTGIKNSRAGNYNMRLDGHIILLNWNSSSTALLRHIASAYAVSSRTTAGVTDAAVGQSQHCAAAPAFPARAQSTSMTPFDAAPAA
jgi:hypothetical protein